MKYQNIQFLVCPHCHHSLDLETPLKSEHIVEGDFYCPKCNQHYPICDGIVHFIRYDELQGTNRRFASLYDKASALYLPISQVAQGIGKLFGISRQDLIRRFHNKAGRFLEVSIGPGVNLPYFFAHSEIDEVVGLDISLGQLQHCQNYCQKHNWDVDLYLAQGEELPFADKSFDGVLHFGGINFFSDKCAAIKEMIRVARHGATIVIADETEKLASVYDWSIPGFGKSFSGKRETVRAPLSLIPEGMKELKAETLWFGAIYCISFVKP